MKREASKRYSIIYGYTLIDETNNTTIYSSIREACKAWNLHNQSITRYLKGKLKYPLKKDMKS